MTERQSFTSLQERAQVFVILVSYNTAGLLRRCLDHLRAASTGLRVSVVIVDNASSDHSLALLRQDHADCQVIANPVNIGFGRANNQALPLCNAPLVLLLNPDAYVSQDALRSSLNHMEQQPRCGVLGLRLVDEAGNGNGSARDFPSSWRSFAINTGLAHHQADDRGRARGAGFINCDWVAGCFYLVRQATIDDVGLFDPRYFLYFEEVDHCRVVQRAGWRVQCLLTSTVIHEGGASVLSGGELAKGGRQLLSPQIEGELLYFRKQDGLRGALRSLFLGLATDAVQMVKGLLRARSRPFLRSHLRHAQELCRLAFVTRIGGRPTR